MTKKIVQEIKELCASSSMELEKISVQGDSLRATIHAMEIPYVFLCELELLLGTSEIAIQYLHTKIGVFTNKIFVYSMIVENIDFSKAA